MRNAAREAVGDISPARLRGIIDQRLVEGSMIPGVLTLLAARTVDADPSEGGADGPDALDRRAAGVQLIYEGLRLTRTLVHDDPWLSDPGPDAGADVEVLAADVLVARGFAMLARTEAADRAVETVRAFGRAETDREAGRAPGTRSLEANVFELAAVAGAGVAGRDVPLPLRQYVVGLARTRPTPLPPAAESLPETVEDVMQRVAARSDPESARPGAAGDS